MSAYVHTVEHVRALVNGGLIYADRSRPVAWGTRPLTPDELERAYRSGAPWGPEAAAIAASVHRELTPATAGMIGAMLLAENQRSVNFRYGEDEIEPVYVHGPDARLYSIVEVLVALDGYEYQAGEHPEWATSEAAYFCDALRRSLVRALPGYDAATTRSIG